MPWSPPGTAGADDDTGRVPRSAPCPLVLLPVCSASFSPVWRRSPHTRTGATEMPHDPSQDSLSTWYTEFFTELPNAFWRAAVPPSSTAAEVDFVIRMTGLSAGDRVLDVPCGSGRHTLELARRGYRVTGLDVSAEAVAHARAVAAAERLEVDLRLGDM